MSSTALITDINTVITNGPNAATKAKAIAAAGPIMDYPGVCNLVQMKFRELAVLIKSVITDTDATDSANLTLLQGRRQRRTARQHLRVRQRRPGPT